MTMNPIAQQVLNHAEPVPAPAPAPAPVTPRRGILSMILQQDNARKLAPVTTPELESPLDTPTWERVVVAKGVERRLTESQAPEVYEIFRALSERRDYLLSRKDQLEKDLQLCKQELDALSPAWQSMSCCVIHPDGIQDAAPEEHTKFMPGSGAGNHNTAQTMTPT